MNKDFGNILKHKRKELGLSVSDIAKKTKIRESFISAIENDNRSAVPDSYYDLFVKKYANYLEISLPEDKLKKKESDHIVELLTESNGTRKKNNYFIIGIKRSLLFVYIHRKFFIVVLVLFLLFLFSRHIFKILNTGEKSEKSESVVRIITIEGDPDDKISVDIRDSIMIDDDKPDFFILKITASDSCYICYYTDTLSVKETILLPGNDLDLRAEKMIEAKLGNSNAVDLQFNKAAALSELKEFKNASSIIRATHYNGVERIRRSEKISEFLKDTYGLE